MNKRTIFPFLEVMFFVRFPFVRFLLAFVLGIFLGMYKVIYSLQRAMGVFLCLGIVYAFLSLLRWRDRRFDNGGIWVGIVGLAALSMAGSVRFLQKVPLHDSQHLIHKATHIEAYEGVLLKEVFYEQRGKLTLRLDRVRIGKKWEKVHGKVMVWLPLESAERYRYGDLLKVEGKLREIPKPRNPHVFDHRRLAAREGIYHQNFISSDAVTHLGYRPPNRCIAIAHRIRDFLAKRLRYRVTHPMGRAVALAMVLGLREEMDPHIQESFSVAGILHILAVSGLHVGMLYTILLFLLALLGASGYRRQWLQSLVLLPCLWGYAMLTAFSPSVIRAVTMVSLSTIARILYRRYHFVNGLATTAFFTLLYDPLWLQDTGFQLSYLAVGGITFFYPRLVKIFKVRHRLLKYIWQLMVLSISVQLTTLPLSLYHFHSFPTYFLLGNLVAVPLASVVLGLGLALCFLGDMPYVGQWLGDLLSYVLLGLNRYVNILQSLPYSRLGPFFPSTWEVVIGYGIIASFVAFFIMKQFRYWVFTTLGALGLCSLSMVRWSSQWQQEVMMVYSLPHQSVISFTKGKRAFILSEHVLDKLVPSYRREVAPSMQAMGVVNPVFFTLREESTPIDKTLHYQVWRGVKVILWQEIKLVWLDQTHIVPPHFSQKQVIDILMVTTYKPSSLEPWLAQLTPKVVILGCSLPWQQRKKLKKELKKHGIACHDLAERGYFQIKK